MISRTKYPIEEEEIRLLLQRAGISGVQSVAPLGAGEYNAVFECIAHSQAYVLKIAPPATVPTLTYEKEIMRSEVYWYGQMREHTAIRVPRVYDQDFGRQTIPADYFIMEKLPGKQLDQMYFTGAERAQASVQTTQMAAQLHQIRGDRFGYVQNRQYDSWYEAIRSMVSNVLEDGRRMGLHSVRGERLLREIDRNRSVLEQAPCTMVNFDIWAPNILCSRRNGSVEYAWIDPERSFWGDRIADFVCLEAGRPLAKKRRSLAAYNSVSPEPVRATREEQIRCAVAQGYMAVIQEVEKLYRYTPRHFGWWRNVASATAFYHLAFQVLER